MASLASRSASSLPCGTFLTPRKAATNSDDEGEFEYLILGLGLLIYIFNIALT